MFFSIFLPLTFIARSSAASVWTHIRFFRKKREKITDDVVITKKSSIEYEAIGMTGLNFLLKFKCSRCPDDTQLLF